MEAMQALLTRLLLFLTLLLVAVGVSAAGQPARVVFVDTGNTGRSVAAEALARNLIATTGAPVSVISRAVNLNPYNTTPEPNFVTLLGQRGVTVGHHTAVQLSQRDVSFSDLILTMTGAHKAWVLTNFPDSTGKVFTLAEYATGTDQDIADAFGQPIEFYQTVLDQLQPLVNAAITKAAA
jgi:protein-tyrosine phosphatase